MELTLHDILRCRQEVQHQLPLPLPGAAGGLPPSIEPEHNTAAGWTGPGATEEQQPDRQQPTFVFPPPPSPPPPSSLSQCRLGRLGLHFYGASAVIITFYRASVLLSVYSASNTYLC